MILLKWKLSNKDVLTRRIISMLPRERGGLAGERGQSAALGCPARVTEQIPRRQVYCQAQSLLDATAPVRSIKT